MNGENGADRTVVLRQTSWTVHGVHACALWLGGAKNTLKCGMWTCVMWGTLFLASVLSKCLSLLQKCYIRYKWEWRRVMRVSDEHWQFAAAERAPWISYDSGNPSRKMTCILAGERRRRFSSITCLFDKNGKGEMNRKGKIRSLKLY